jgi:hypothetical protein
MMRVYEAKYNYETEGEEELNLAVGDILIGRGEVQGDWLQVERFTDKTVGFVPFAYVEELNEKEAAKFLASKAAETDKKEDNKANIEIKKGTNEDESRNTKNIPFSRKALSTSSANSISSARLRNRAALSIPPFMKSESNLDVRNNIVESYEKSEKIFKQAMKQREEMFQKMEDKLNDTSKEILHFIEKNDELIDRIKQLDIELEAEKNRSIDTTKFFSTKRSV